MSTFPDSSISAPLQSPARPIALAMLALAGLTLGTRVLGFAEKQVLAYYFGADARVDAFFVATGAVMVLFFFARELVEPAFLPIFLGNLEGKAERSGWQLFACVALGLLSAAGLAAVIVFVAAGRVAAHLAPGFDAPTLELTTRLIRIMVPSAVVLALSTLSYITLNAYRSFALPASGDLVLKALPLVACVTLVSDLGITALAVGVVAGALGRLAVHTAGLRTRLHLLVWPEPAARSEVRVLLLLMAPLVLGVAFSQVSELADNYFASMVGHGGVSARTYAKKIVDLPLQLLPYTLSVVLFPYFSHLATRGERAPLYASLGRAVSGVALVFAALALGVYTLAEPTVTLLFERGAFGPAARVLTAAPLRMYALGLVSFAVEALYMPFYYALRDTLTPVLVGMGCVVVNICATALLVEPLGVAGVALALTISKTLKVLALTVLLRRKYGAFAWPEVARSAARIAAATAIAAVGLGALRSAWTAPTATAPLPAQLAYLGVSAVVGAGLLFATAAALGARERELVPAALTWLRRRRR